MVELEPLIHSAEWLKKDKREYVVAGKQTVLYNGFKAIIKNHGYSKQINEKWARYFDFGAHSYYIKENVLYRVKQK